jgi:hypothetical protein
MDVTIIIIILLLEGYQHEYLGRLPIYWNDLEFYLMEEIP